MKVIFLDMDGVLCTSRACTAYGGRHGLMAHLDPVAVKLVEKLCEESGAQIVLSSTWRETFDKEAMTFILKNGGMADVPWHQCWKTPTTLQLSSRGTELRLWMANHGEPEKYVILDDYGDFLEDQKPNLVRTHVADGLRYEDFIKAKEILQ